MGSHLLRRHPLWFSTLTSASDSRVWITARTGRSRATSRVYPSLWTRCLVAMPVSRWCQDKSSQVGPSVKMPPRQARKSYSRVMQVDYLDIDASNLIHSEFLARNSIVHQCEMRLAFKNSG